MVERTGESPAFRPRATPGANARLREACVAPWGRKSGDRSEPGASRRAEPRQKPARGPERECLRTTRVCW